MFEINLIKDRVVPRNLGMKRLVIVGSFVGFMLVITLFVVFFAIQVGMRVNTTETAIDRVRAQINDQQPAYDSVIQAQGERTTAQRRQRQLFSLWDGPINFAAAFRYLVVGLKNHEQLKGKASVIHAEFEKNRNNNQFRIVAVTNDATAAEPDPDTENSLSNIARALAQGTGAKARVQYASVQDLREFEDPMHRQFSTRPPGISGAVHRIGFLPSNRIVFTYEDEN